jgi:co-chaperonin GroES (HSP10)
MNVSTLRPINDRIVVRLFKADAIDADKFPTLAKLGIVAPESAEEKDKVCGKTIQFDNAAHRGEVLAVGLGKWVLCKKCNSQAPQRRPMSVAVGDVVAFGRFADFIEDGVVIIQEDDIVGVEVAEAVSACV